MLYKLLLSLLSFKILYKDPYIYYVWSLTVLNKENQDIPFGKRTANMCNISLTDGDHDFREGTNNIRVPKGT